MLVLNYWPMLLAWVMADCSSHLTSVMVEFLLMLALQLRDLEECTHFEPGLEELEV